MPKTSTRTPLAMAIVAGLWACTHASQVAVGGRDSHAPAPWEQRTASGQFENRGIARIDRIGDRWALTVMCDGIHTTYVQPAPDVDLETLEGRFVHVRYRWIERPVPDAQCLVAPCDVTERLIALDELATVQSTAPQAQAQARQCVRD